MDEDFFTILVVGEFKRGKTTFVNALLKDDLLISDVLPETATIQAIIHGDEKKAQVIFQDGTVINGKASKEFLKEYKLDRVGVFEYSREEGTPAARMKDQVHPATKKRRHRELMEIQNAVSFEKNKKRIGKIYDVVVDGVSDDGMFYKGRSYMEAPEEDGYIYFAAKEELKTGQTVRVRIVVAEDYDLVGEQIAR
jgi:hypothetical protein